MGYYIKAIRKFNDEKLKIEKKKLFQYINFTKKMCSNAAQLIYNNFELLISILH